MRRLVATAVVALAVAGSASTAAASRPPGDPVGMGSARPRATLAPPDPATCPSTLDGAVVDRANQRAWLCTGGAIVRVMAITSARDQPDPGVYPVFAEDLHTTSYYGDRPSTLDNFVAFTRGKHEGARIAFHAVPRYRDGSLAQPVESLGTQAMFGASSGCIRVRPADAVAIWDLLAVGDAVNVVS